MNTPLVTASALVSHLQDWVVLDCRHNLQDVDAGQRAYLAGHIPGACFLHLDRDLSGLAGGQRGRHPLPSPSELKNVLERSGVGSGRSVVVYDHGECMFAARLWWMLRWLGHDHVAVLERGWTGWIEAGNPVSTEVPQPQSAVFSLQERVDWIVDTRFVQSHLNDPAIRLVDARAADRFRGENETLDPVGGHIPGACNRPFRDNLESNGCFKHPDVLRSEFEGILEGRSPEHLVHQCGSGVTACHNLLAMEYAGLPGGKLYPGSWSAWCADPARPVAVGSP